MTETEMLQALEAVRREHPRFELSSSRATDWYRRFGHIPLGHFRAMVDRVLDNTRFPPSREDFSKAEREVVPRKETVIDERACNDHEKWLVDEGGMQRDSYERGYRFVRKSRMDVVLKAFGHQWVNQELGVENQQQCLAFVKAFSAGSVTPDTKALKHRHRYKDWLEAAFKNAWKVLNRREPTTEELNVYE
jgi:hypothetical protein